MFLYVFFFIFCLQTVQYWADISILVNMQICSCHPSIPARYIAFLLLNFNIHTYVHMSLTYYKRLNEGIISVKTESMTSNFWPNTYFQCSTTCKNNFRQNWINGGFCPNTYNFPSISNSPLWPRYLVSLIIWFSTLFDFPRYWIFQTAVLSELVIDWIIIIGCVESCQREMGCWYLLSRLKIQMFENVT